MTRYETITDDPRIPPSSTKTGEAGTLREVDYDADYEKLNDTMKTLTNEVGLMRSEVFSRPAKWMVLLYDLGEEGYVLNHPISIVIEEDREEEIITASYPEVEVFAQGVTESVAISRLKEEILDLFDDLSESEPDELGAMLRSWLRLLERLISRVE